MSEKYLPIKIFEKRKGYDDRDTEGGGSDKPPKWVLSGQELVTRSQHLNGCVKGITTEYKKRVKDKKLPLVVTSHLSDDAIAKSHRDRIVNVLESDNKDNVIGFYGDRSVLSMVTTEDVLFNIGNSFSDIKNDMLISSITDMEVFRPYVEKDKEENVYKIKLINYNDFDLNTATKRLFGQVCMENHITVAGKIKYTSELTVYKVIVDSMEQLDTLEEFEGLYSVEPMEKIEASLDFFEADLEIPIKVPDGAENYPVVGVLDTGIKSIRPLSEWLDAEQHLNYTEEYQNNSHGTFVAGIIEYGNELNGKTTSTVGGIRLFNAVVYPDSKKEVVYVCDLIDHIREAIERNSGRIKIWNLSLGTVEESELDEFSDFGMALDNIQDENNVLIIKSAGNCTNFLKNIPHKSRVAKSADSVRSLVIGSIAEKQELYDEAEKNMPSPFTRIGPGPGNIVKPDLVYYGGNAGLKDGKLIKNGVPSFDLNGKIAYDCGTSFSTPQVSRIVAELNHLINEEFDPLLIKALTIHSAQYPENNHLIMSDKVKQMGFGMPMEAGDILYNSPNEITLILRDTLEKGSFIEMFDFPFPKGLVDDKGYFKGQVILTLVNKAILDEKQAGEYCQSNLDVMFGTYETEKNRDTNKRTVKNPRGLEDNRSILDDGLFSARIKKDYAGIGFERECTLIKYGKKYHPVKKYAFDLKDMTPSNKDKLLKSDRKWYLKITGLYRDFIEKDSIKRNYQLGQEFCMILTIRDPEDKIPVYDEVTQQLTLNNFIHYNIQVRNDIYISAES